MTTTTYPHIAFTDERVPYVEGTGIKLGTIIMARMQGGLQPEQIAADYPPLTPGQVYMALAYYYDHKDAIERQMAERDRINEELRGRIDSSSVFRTDLKARGLLP